MRKIVLSAVFALGMGLAASTGASAKMKRLAEQASWLNRLTSLAARSATSSMTASEAKPSGPIMEIEVFGSNETS